MKGFKKMLAVMLSVMMVFCMVPAMGASAETTDVTEMSIGTVAALEALCDGLNNGEFASTITVTLTQNLDLGGITWTPIKSFAGEFNGKRKTISNFKIDATVGSGGFFGNLGWNCDLGQMGHVVTDCSADVDVTTKSSSGRRFCR